MVVDQWWGWYSSSQPVEVEKLDEVFCVLGNGKMTPCIYLMSQSVQNPQYKFVQETFFDPERGRARIGEFLPKKCLSFCFVEFLRNQVGSSG